jgi:predicted naringenin-chalcone synthase
MAYRGSRSVLDDDSVEAMTWTIGDTGFQMGLSSRVPDVIADHLPAYTDALLADHGLERASVGAWAIHPGGRRIVERAREVLGLSGEDVAPSLGVLRDFGNMSSPTILFVLQRLLGFGEAEGVSENGTLANSASANGASANSASAENASNGTAALTSAPSAEPGPHGAPDLLVAMAFGPGLTIEGALFERA